jgi:hypothetical protein
VWHKDSVHATDEHLLMAPALWAVSVVLLLMTCAVGPEIHVLTGI